MTIKAITFDLWDTLIHDDSDEPKRAARGLRTKRDERRHLVWRALDRLEPTPRETVILAYNVAEAAFRRVWQHQRVTWTVAERIDVILTGLQRSLPAGALAELISRHEEMELEVVPDPIEGAGEAIAALAGADYRLGVVSDAIVSPGRCLRRWLEMHDMLGHFGSFAFSDEVGRAKPHRAMFEKIARELDVELTEMVHVGDRDHNDVKGPQALGMKAILFVATRDRDRTSTSADAICERHADLPRIVEALSRTRS